MTPRNFAVLVALGLVLTTGVTVLVVVIFGGSSSTLEAPGTDAGIAINPRGIEPADVAVAVMSGIYTWQPAVQESSWEALHSQLDDLTGTLAMAAAQQPTHAPKPLPEWAAWSRSNDVVTAVVQLNGDTANNGKTGTVAVTISQTVQHPSGETTPYTTYTATVHLEQTDDGWKVANYRLDSASR